MELLKLEMFGCISVIQYQEKYFYTNELKVDRVTLDKANARMVFKRDGETLKYRFKIV